VADVVAAVVVVAADVANTASIGGCQGKLSVRFESASRDSLKTRECYNPGKIAQRS
jgi:hypothetical protein